MKHKFIRQPLNPDKEHFDTEEKCVICKRNEHDHGSQATCENCGNTGDCDFRNGILVCNSCMTGAPLPQATKPQPPLQLDDTELKKLEIIKTSLGSTMVSIESMESQLIKEGEYTTIKTAADYFNNRTESIIEMEKRILADPLVSPEDKRYEMGRQVRAHLMHLKEVLFAATEIQLQAVTEQRADYAYLNKLISSLRNEEREKLHLETIDYTPKAPPKSAPKVSGPRVSKTDKMIQSLADMLKIPFAQAKSIYEGQLKSKGIVCTCKETPGVCRVHT